MLPFALAVCAVVSTSVRAEDYPSISVQKPFMGACTFDNIAEVLGEELTDDDIATLRSVELYQYNFPEPYRDCVFGRKRCGRERVEVSRVIAVSGRQLVEDLFTAIQSREKGGCDFIHLRNNRIYSIRATKVSLTGHVYAKDRACDKFFGTHDITTTEGDWTLDLRLKLSEPTRTPDADVWMCEGVTKPPGDNSANDRRTDRELWGHLAMPASPDVDLSTDLFGLLDLGDWIGNVIGRLLVQVPKMAWHLFKMPLGDISALPKFRGDIIENLGGKLIVWDSLSSFPPTAFGGDVWHSIRKYRKLACEIEEIDRNYKLDVLGTRFADSTIKNEFILYLRETTSMPAYYLPRYYAVKVTELQRIKKWSDEDHVHVVRSGDSLWALAEKQYGSGYAWVFLLAANPELKSSSLIPEAEIKIPAAWRPIQAERNGSVILPGDSLWSRYVAAGRGAPWADYAAKVPPGSTDANRVFPQQIHREIEPAP